MLAVVEAEVEVADEDLEEEEGVDLVLAVAGAEVAFLRVVEEDEVVVEEALQVEAVVGVDNRSPLVMNCIILALAVVESILYYSCCFMIYTLPLRGISTLVHVKRVTLRGHRWLLGMWNTTDWIGFHMQCHRLSWHMWLSHEPWVLTVLAMLR